jgi:hypothetical protein
MQNEQMDNIGSCTVLHRASLHRFLQKCKDTVIHNSLDAQKAGS